MKRDLFPLFLSGYPCRYQCAYCNAAGSSGVTEVVCWETLRQNIDTWVNRTDRVAPKEIAIYGNDLSALQPEVFERIVALGSELQHQEKIQGIRVSVRPDTILSLPDEILDLFSTIEIGIPSLNDDTLKRIRRNHDVRTFFLAVERIREKSIDLGFQTMLGLPGETRQRDLETAIKLAALRPDFVRVHPTLVLLHSELENRFKRGEYSVLSLEEAIELCADVCEIYSDQSVVVARCGFHLPDKIRRKILVAGPWHPAFGQLVKSRIWRRQLYQQLVNSPETFLVTVPSKDLSDAIGQKGSNVNWLSRQLGRQVKIVPESVGQNLYLLLIEFESFDYSWQGRQIENERNAYQDC